MTNYDEDFSDPRQHCQHGTFIGSWWGPDYMCGWCEDGVSVAEMHEALAMQATYRAERAEAAYNRLIAVLETVPFNAALATTLVEMTQRGHSFA